MSDLTTAQRSMLVLIGRETPGFSPRIDSAHPKHLPALHSLRALGLVFFDWSHPRITITPAGRAMLAAAPKETT